MVGHKIGWGIHYNPEERNRPDFNPKGEQLVYCYITANMEIIAGQMMMQPEGGFYPVVLLRDGGLCWFSCEELSRYITGLCLLIKMCYTLNYSVASK